MKDYWIAGIFVSICLITFALREQHPIALAQESSPPPIGLWRSGSTVGMPIIWRAAQEKPKLKLSPSLVVYGSVTESVLFSRCNPGSGDESLHIPELKKALAAHDAGELARWCLDGHPLGFAVTSPPPDTVLRREGAK